MPIMDGLEACKRIYNYLSQENNFFGIVPKNPTYSELVSPKLPDEVLISSLKNTQRKKSQVYNFSSSNG